MPYRSVRNRTDLEYTARVDFTRRGLFKKGIVGGALLLVGGGTFAGLRPTVIGHRPQTKLQLLDEREYAIFAAIADRVVPGDNAGPKWPRAADVDCAGKVDALIAQVHPDAGSEFKRLLRLFDNGLAGFLVTADTRPFTALDPLEKDARLRAWDHSRIALLRSGYQAMVRLAHATYYASPEIYPRIGYPGPPEMGR